MMRVWMWAVVCLIALVGCTGGAPEGKEVKVEPNAGGGTPIEGTLKVALLTPGNVNDSGWSAIAYRGLKAIEKDLGAEVANKVATDASTNDDLRSYAQDGFHLVLGHGFEYNAPAVAMAKEFPNTTFVTSSGGEFGPNAGAFRFYMEQAFYLAGMMAGRLSTTGKVGMIGGPDVPSIRSTFKAFAEGAKVANPDIVVIEKFTGKNDDVAAAKQATLQAIAEGADFLIHQTNNAAPGFFGACEEKKVYCFGANENQNDMSPQVIASAVINAEAPFVSLAKEIKEGKYVGGIRLVGMVEGAVEFVKNPKAGAAVTAEAQAFVDAAADRILAGELIVPKDEF